MRRILEQQKGVQRWFLLPDIAWYELTVAEVTETTVKFCDGNDKAVFVPIQSVLAVAEVMPMGRRAR